jgi:hypothetical protein
LVTETLLKAIAILAPSFIDVAKKLGVDLSRVRREDLMVLLLLQHTQLAESTNKLLNEMHTLIKKIHEDTGILLRRTENPS